MAARSGTGVVSNPAFMRHSGGLTVDEVAGLAGARLPSPLAHHRRIVNVASLDRAAPGDLSFFDDSKFGAAAATTHAGACLTTKTLAKELPARVAALIVREPYRAFVIVAREMFAHALRPSSLAKPGEVTGAHIDPTARLENDVTIEPGAVVGPGAEIGTGTVIGATAVVGADVRIGRDCSIGSGTVIAAALIGDRVVVHPGCKIGQDGFGFLMSGKGHLKVPQLGRVIIQDDVEIGSSTTIDRGAIGDTVIGEGTKIDNLVQIGHNVCIGRHCMVVSQSGIAESCVLEDFVVLGGRAGLETNVTVGEGAQLAAASNAYGDVPAGARWGGTPAKPVKPGLAK